MSSIPANLSRVPNLLASQLLLSGITRTSVDSLRVQSQLASGKKLTKFSDDAIAAGAASVLQHRLAVGAQRLQNLASAQNNLDFLDASVGDATALVREAKSLASGQIGVTSDAATRTNQAVVVDGMLKQLFDLANRSTNGVYVFGGSTATSPPIAELRGGYRYTGRGTGLLAELGPASDVPISIGGNNAIGETSIRLRGSVDLNPSLALGTRLTDLVGARNLGVAKGSVTLTFNGGPVTTVDLSKADTVGDVVTTLRSAIQKYETDNGVTILGPGGVSTSGGAITIDVVNGSPAPLLSFSDVGTGTTGADLGLTSGSFSATTPSGADLNPRLTLLTPVGNIPGLTVPLGTVRFRFTSGAGTSFTDVDLSGAQTVDGIRNLIETQVPGVRVEINARGTGLDVVNEIAGPALSIEPTGSGVDTATELGIRSLSVTTPLADFNDGRGVRIVDGQVDPATGVATKAVNSDLRIFLGNGQAFDVDLRPQDLVSTNALLTRINAEFNAAVGQPPVVPTAPALALGQFSAGLSAAGNGIALTQALGGTPGPIRVEQLNNSPAAEDLGFLAGSYDAVSAAFTAQDRSGIRVDNIFTALVRLRDALRTNDSAGITVAGSGLDAQVDRLAQTQALVGVYANRVKLASERQDDENTLTEKVRSQVQDLDYAEAITRFNLLQTQLQATMQAGSISRKLSLLDFLG